MFSDYWYFWFVGGSFDRPLHRGADAKGAGIVSARAVGLGLTIPSAPVASTGAGRLAEAGVIAGLKDDACLRGEAGPVQRGKSHAATVLRITVPLPHLQQRCLFLKGHRNRVTPVTLQSEVSCFV